MPYYCNACELKTDTKDCHICKTNKHAYVVKVLTSEEVEEMLERKRKLYLESVKDKKR